MLTSLTSEETFTVVETTRGKLLLRWISFAVSKFLGRDGKLNCLFIIPIKPVCWLDCGGVFIDEGRESLNNGVIVDGVVNPSGSLPSNKGALVLSSTYSWKLWP